MKVGREEIVGLVVALKRFLERDPAEEEKRQRDLLNAIAEQVLERTRARTELLHPDESPRAYPTLLVYPATGNPSDQDEVVSLVNRLIEGDPPLAVSQNFKHLGAIGLIASAMRSDQADSAASRLVQELNR